MMLSSKQKRIMNEINTNPDRSITLARAVELCGDNLYCNASKHVGVTLSNMVRRGLIERMRPGVFRATKHNHNGDELEFEP